MRPALRVQLLRDNNFIEEDDIREMCEQLSNTIEDYRTINVGETSDNSANDSSGQSDFEY